MHGDTDPRRHTHVHTQLRAIRELLAQREITFSAYQSAFTAHQRKQADHAKATASGNASKAAKIEVALKKVRAYRPAFAVVQVARLTAHTHTHTLHPSHTPCTRRVDPG